MPTHPPLSTLANAAVASSGTCHCYPEWHNFPVYADKVKHHNPVLPGLLVQVLPVLNHDRTDHNTKPMEHWCIATAT